MDGLLIVDKPVGPTSHDVVVRVRRRIGEPRIGHTGTLDPAASGVLPLVLGRATRLARFLTCSDKSYDAVVRLGVATDTYDGQGALIGSPWRGPFPTPEEIDRALDAFRGTFLQQPPAYSAKRIAGERSHRLARRQRAAALVTSPFLPRLAPVQVTAHSIAIVGVEADLVTLRIDCAAGFYVRSLAHDLGQRLGLGAHLSALRRTRSGQGTLAGALTLDEIERDVTAASIAVVPLGAMLTNLKAVILTEEGERRVAHGRDVGPADVQGLRRETALCRLGDPEDSGNPGDPGDPGNPGSPGSPGSPGNYVRLLNREGNLLGIAEPIDASGLLHPSLVLM